MSEYPIPQDLKALTEERDYFRGQYHAKLVRESQLLDDLIKTTKNLETELESVLSLQGQVKSLEAQNTRLREALDSVRQFGSDTLSGRADGPDDREWHREAVLEMRNRARAAIAQAKEQPNGK